MRWIFLGATALPLLAFAGSSAPGSPPRAPAGVAVAPFTVENDSAGVLRDVADRCLERLVAGLAAKGVTVTQRAQLSAEKLDAARPARWAVLGHLERKNGQFQAELRLLDVESAEELRSYFNADQEPAGIVKFGDAAALRIATVIQQQ